MAGKWRYVGAALVVALGVAIMPLEAQRGPGFGGRGLEGPGWPGGPGALGGPNLGSSIELALENQADLGLTGEQVAELQELKAVIDGDVAPLAEEMSVLREGIRSGEVPREEGLRQMQALKGELMTASAPLRGMVQGILTVEQHQKLQPLVRETRPGLAGAGRLQGGGQRAYRGMGGGMGSQGPGVGIRGGAGPRGNFNAPGLAPGPGNRQAPPMVGRRRGIGLPPRASQGWGRGGAMAPGA